jgi:hypothetical protein
MNCQEMETMITDLARRGALESDARESALAHLKQCPRCGERLADETMLTEGLAAWAASMDEQAPARLEEKLRAAFRQRAIPAPRRRWVRFATAGSIAAAVLLFKLLTPATEKAPPVAKPVSRPLVATAQERVADPSDPPARPMKRTARMNPRPAPVEIEVSTEFLPVVQGDGWTPLDGGRLVRVRLPRSAMGAFGLPVDERRARERVQADVMLSDDGQLRAIRFVR